MGYRKKIELASEIAEQIIRFDLKFKAGLSEGEAHTAKESALELILIESHELFRGINGSVKDNNMRVAGSLLRSLLESTANAHWIVSDKSGKRAKRYLGSINSLGSYIKESSSISPRIPKDVISWTNSSAEDRVNAFSPQAGAIWDYCSMFTHVSPSSYELSRGSEKVLEFIMLQANVYCITMRYIAVENSRLFSPSASKSVRTLAEKTMGSIR